MRCATLPLMLLAASAVLAAACGSRAPSEGDVDPALVEPGVSAALAEERARRVSALRYELFFDIPEELDEPVRGRGTIRLVLADADAPLILDFTGPLERVTALRAGGRTVAVSSVNGHLIVPADALQAGENEIEVEFLAGDAPLNRSRDFLYTLFVPARAREAFPCIDQPDIKARYTLEIDIPAAWEALANGAETARERKGDRRRLGFAETEPLSTYLFAFAAGRFEVEEAERDGRTFRMLHRETDETKLGRNLDAIFDLHALSLAWLERYTGIPYPWDQFGFVLVPAFQFGGMEHPGAIFYNAPALLLDETATQNQLLGRASLIAHETAHMWFGNLVTMRWFDDVWMKEVFANFMAAKIVNPAFPEINHDLRFLFAHYPAAYDVDRTAGANAIRQQLDNLNDAASLYGAIIYQKAPIMMRQLERLVGEGPFQDGLREYLARHAFGNASWPELIALLDVRSEVDLAVWSRVWVEEPGRPAIRTELRLEDGRIAGLRLAQRDPRGRGLTWTQQLEAVIGLPERSWTTEAPSAPGGTGRTAIVPQPQAPVAQPFRAAGLLSLPVRLDGPEVEVAEARGLPAPRFVLPAGGGLGYGRFELDAVSRQYLLERLPAIEDPLTRGTAWVVLWDALLDHEVTPDALVNLGMHALAVEGDELNVQRVLGYVQRAYWRFLSPEARLAIAPRLERTLRDGLQRAGTTSRKAAWFAVFRNTTLTPEGIAWLERIWRREEEVPGLTFGETDEIEMALELAVREVPAWDAILAGQIERTENPDRRERLAFVRPALSADPAVRDAFFDSLRDVTNRRREPWVLEGVSYLHHPLRAGHAERHLRPALELLPEIRRTGDIFFPKRWTDATLGGHQSAGAATIVRQVIDGLPADYPPRLRLMLLASADELFRAAGL
jgi:aminopeptidase N